jgi:hypothetical protein
VRRVAIPAVTILGRGHDALFQVFSDGRTGVPSSGPVPLPRPTADLEAVGGAVSWGR